MSRLRIMADVDAALSGGYGAFRGDTRAPLYQLILRRAREAALLPVVAAVEDIRHRLRREPELLAIIDQDVA